MTGALGWGLDLVKTLKKDRDAPCVFLRNLRKAYFIREVDLLLVFD